MLLRPLLQMPLQQVLLPEQPQEPREALLLGLQLVRRAAPPLGQTMADLVELPVGLLALLGSCLASVQRKLLKPHHMGIWLAPTPHKVRWRLLMRLQ